MFAVHNVRDDEWYVSALLRKHGVSRISSPKMKNDATLFWTLFSFSLSDLSPRKVLPLLLPLILQYQGLLYTSLIPIDPTSLNFVIEYQYIALASSNFCFDVPTYDDELAFTSTFRHQVAELIFRIYPSTDRFLLQ